MKKQDINTYVPRCKKPKIEFYDNPRQAVERYNELLNNPRTHSIFLDPVKDKKGFWSIEVEEYTDAWFLKYGNNR